MHTNVIICITMSVKPYQSPDGFEAVRIDNAQAFEIGLEPIVISLGEAGRSLHIIDPTIHKLGAFVTGKGAYCDLMVVDEALLDIDSGIGYEGIQQGDRLVLGRSYRQNRFNFSEGVSPVHVALSIFETKHGFRNVLVEDLSEGGNGVYVLKPKQERIDIFRNIRIGSYTTSSLSRIISSRESHFVDKVNPAIGVFDGSASSSIEGSDIAVNFASDYLADRLRHMDAEMSKIDAEDAVRKLVLETNNALRKKHRRTKKPRTTATLAKIFQNQEENPYVVIANVGDGRAYLMRDGEMSHLSLDHHYTYVGSNWDNVMKRQLSLSEVTSSEDLDSDSGLRQAFLDRLKNYGFIGNEVINPPVTVTSYDVKPGDKIMIVSDGIHDNLTSTEISSLFNMDKEPRSMAFRMVMAAKEVSIGGKSIRRRPDDMTAVVMQIN